MSQILQSSTHKSVLRKRERLVHAINVLEANSVKSVMHRVALAEAEFRVAILPGTDLQEAIERIQKAITYDPFHPKYFFHLGRFFYRNGNYRGALPEFRHTLKLAPDSHRTYVHLALTLLELENKEKNLGRDLLDALLKGVENELGQYLVEFDAMIETQRTDGKKTQPATKRKPKKPKDADKQQPTVPCRWTGIWRVALVEQLTRPKPLPKQIDAQLEKGIKNLNGKTGVAEYAIACLLLLLGGDTPKTVRALLKGPKLNPHAEHPAVQLAETTVTLTASETAIQFIEQAVAVLQADSLPLELVCWLHYLKYGPDTSLPITEALSLLNKYPHAIQEMACFKELRIAILDGYARKAWAEGHFNYSRLLWRETIPLDPTRIATYHNLALVATRTKSHVDYTNMWNRAIEFRYLYAAAVGDVQVMLEDRRTLHLSFAQQSKQRYCKSTKSSEQPPEEKELAAWIADRDAFEVWLNEWDLYYLNSRLRFRSPIHLLGIARDALPEMAESARDALLRQLGTSLQNQPWSGIKTFCDLAEQVIGNAFESVSDLVVRARDLYYEQEQLDADTLAREAIERGFLLHRMMTLLAENPAAKNIAIGCALARHLFALPWKILQPICVNQGKIDRNIDLVEIFEDRFLSVVAGAQSEPENEKEVSERLSVLDECLAILPHNVELRILRCQILLFARQNADAYTSALEAYALAENIEKKEEAHNLKQSCTNIIDNSAFAELPERLRQPQNLQEAEETLKQGCMVLERFPKAGGLRTFLSDLMIKLGTEKHIKQAISLLEEGLEEALNDEQREQVKTLLQKTNAQSTVAKKMEKIKTLLEGASEQVKNAIDEINHNPSVKSIEKGREVLTVAIKDAEQAAKTARNAELKDAENQAEALVRHFKEIQKKFQEH